jgi:Tfp pilus assembly protein FimV
MTTALRSDALRSDALRHRPAPPARWRPAAGHPGLRLVQAGSCDRLARQAPGAPPQSAAHPTVLARRRHRQRARRRRLLLALASGVAIVALALPWGGAGGHPLATPGPVLAGAAATPGAIYVVQPGDTMWSIAQRLDPTGDPRAVVAQLEAQVGSDTLQPGERIHLP